MRESLYILRFHCLINFRFMTFVLFRHGQHLLLLLNGVRKPFLVRTHVNRAYRLLKTCFKKRCCAFYHPRKQMLKAVAESREFFFLQQISATCNKMIYCKTSDSGCMVKRTTPLFNSFCSNVTKQCHERY